MSDDTGAMHGGFHATASTVDRREWAMSVPSPHQSALSEIRLGIVADTRNAPTRTSRPVLQVIPVRSPRSKKDAKLHDVLALVNRPVNAERTIDNFCSREGEPGCVTPCR